MAIINQKWQIAHSKQIIQKAGPRYTPELNVNLPISEIFDGISRSELFYTNIRENYGELLYEFKYITSKYENAELQKSYNKLKKDIGNLFTFIEEIKAYNTKKISWNEINDKSKELNESLLRFINDIRSEKESVKDVKTPPRKDGSYQQSPSEKFNSDIHHCYKTQKTISYFEELSLSNKAKLSNQPFLLLTGSAGTGKTHLLCDIAEHRIKNKLPTFVVFGEYFSSERDFWSQLLSQLRIEKKIKTKKEFLIEINKLGEKAKSRSLIVIDALNENIAHALNFWKINLAGIIQDIKKYPHVALILSVRNGYNKYVLTEKDIRNFISVEHHGFPQEIIWNALNSFFQFYNITFPEIPLLHPEFYNPLFLKFFCEKNRNSKPSLKGGNSLKDVFEDFIINIGLEVLKTFNPGAQKRENGKNILWDGIVKDTALWMAQNGKSNIPEKELASIVKKYFPCQEGEVIALMQRRVLMNKLEWDKKVYYSFTYNKFSDHITDLVNPA